MGQPVRVRASQPFVPGSTPGVPASRCSMRHATLTRGITAARLTLPLLTGRPPAAGRIRSPSGGSIRRAICLRSSIGRAADLFDKFI